MPKRATPLAIALQRAMDARGLTVTDLARAIGVDPETFRAIADGRTARPGKAIRDALDAYLAPLAAGTTLRIAREGGDYPSDGLRQLLQLAQQLPPDALTQLVAFLRAVEPLDGP